MQEHAIAISRVSSGRQREEDQTPGLTQYGERKGYILEAIIPINGKSAFHGKHLKHVQQAVEQYIKNGEATVVIFRDVDRSSRQGPRQPLTSGERSSAPVAAWSLAARNT